MGRLGDVHHLDAISNIPRRDAVVDGAKSCIIVCGLHRSGTSAITRLINLLGADVAEDLLPATAFNSRGYWESQAVVAAHSQLLRSVAPAHDGRFDPAPLTADWLASDAARQAKRRLADIVKADFSDSSLFVVKDPRIARLLPLWLDVLHDLDIAPMIVVPFRNPLEVAASLARRDHISLPKALLLYLHVHLELEQASRTVPRVFVRYDRLLHDWHPFARRLTRVSRNGLAPPCEGVAIEIGRFLTTELYHHRFSREHMMRRPEVAPAIVEIFDAMSEAAESGDEAALRGTFDRVGMVANAAARLYQGFVSSELRHLRREVRQIRESFESSTSWRITAPLRWVKRRVSSRTARRI